VRVEHLDATQTKTLVRGGKRVRDGSLVLVLRDAGRHAWQKELATALEPDVVVELGLPTWRPDSPAPYVVTHGAGRASLEAAASLLARPGA
jgi:beta-N-acetylhexosaminidase